METNLKQIVVCKKQLKSIINSNQNSSDAFTLVWMIGLKNYPQNVLQLIISCSNFFNQQQTLEQEIQFFQQTQINGLSVTGLLVLSQENQNSEQEQKFLTNFQNILVELNKCEYFNKNQQLFAVINSGKNIEEMEQITGTLINLKQDNKQEPIQIKISQNNFEVFGVLQNYFIISSTENFCFEIDTQQKKVIQMPSFTNNVPIINLLNINEKIIIDQENLSFYEKQAGQKKGKSQGKKKQIPQQANQTSVQSQVDTNILEHLKKIKSENKKYFDKVAKTNQFSLENLNLLPVLQIQCLFEIKNNIQNSAAAIMMFDQRTNQKLIQFEADTISLVEFGGNVELVNQLTQHLKFIDQDFNNFISLNLSKLLDQKNNFLQFGLQSFQVLDVPMPLRAILQIDQKLKQPLQNDKQIIHNRYHLSQNRPLLRNKNRVQTLSNFSFNKKEKLKNVHYFLPSKIGENVIQHLMHGDYVFYHYHQDGFDDKGWGCAYRSLQTVLSWFIEEGYVKEFNMPMHKEIQQILFEIGDKPKDFVGTNDWIGALEVSYILQKLLDIDCKIVHLSNGSDIITKIREFQEHFQQQGTPIMFGGGVYAYTMLGIEENVDTNEYKFLILDPHYTGQDNIKNIIEKTGISWQKTDLFLDNTFYNFCLPLRSQKI